MPLSSSSAPSSPNLLLLVFLLLAATTGALANDSLGGDSAMSTTSSSYEERLQRVCSVPQGASSATCTLPRGSPGGALPPFLYSPLPNSDIGRKIYYPVPLPRMNACYHPCTALSCIPTRTVL